MCMSNIWRRRRCTSLVVLFGGGVREIANCTVQHPCVRDCMVYYAAAKREKRVKNAIEWYLDLHIASIRINRRSRLTRQQQQAFFCVLFIVFFFACQSLSPSVHYIVLLSSIFSPISRSRVVVPLLLPLDDSI